MDRPLPNYFLADLPGDAVVSPSVIRDACLNLRRNQRQFLADRPTSSLIRVLSDLAEAWLQPDYPFRQLALREGPASTGFSEAVLTQGLDQFFQQLTIENLQALVQQDLGSLQRLDGFCQTHTEIQERRWGWARGPELMVHIAAGNLPNPSLSSLILGLLVRSAQFLKCATGGTLIPRLFAHSLYDAEPKLASCIEIASWPRESFAHEEAALREADLVTVTGSDEAVRNLQSRTPAKARFIGYGSKVSFAYIAAGSLSGYGVSKIIQRAADDVVAWDQAGCLSPHVFYVQLQGASSPETFAEKLAQELATRQLTLPRGAISLEEALAIQSRRDFYSVRASRGNETKVWSSPGSTDWTVVYDTEGMFQVSCLNRFIHVKSAPNLEDVLRLAEPVRDKVSTVALAAPADEAAGLAQRIARWGATRICAVGRMQSPPLGWRHDGRPALGDLVTWTDWEQ